MYVSCFILLVVCILYICFFTLWVFAPRLRVNAYVQAIFLGLSKMSEIVFTSFHAYCMLVSIYFLISYYSPFSWSAIRSLQKGREFLVIALLVFAPASILGNILRYIVPPSFDVFDRELTTFIVIQFYNVFFLALTVVLGTATIAILVQLLFHSYLIQHYYPQADLRTRAIAREASVISSLMLFQITYMIIHTAKLVLDWVLDMNALIYANTIFVSDLAVFFVSQALCFTVLNMQTYIPLNEQESEERELRDRLTTTAD